MESYDDLVKKNVMASISKFQQKKAMSALDKGMSESQLLSSVGFDPQTLSKPKNEMMQKYDNMITRNKNQTPMRQESELTANYPEFKEPTEDLYDPWDSGNNKFNSSTSNNAGFDPSDFSSYKIVIEPAQGRRTPSGLRVDQEKGILYMNFGGADSDGSILAKQLQNLGLAQSVTGRQPLQKGEKDLQQAQAESEARKNAFDIMSEVQKSEAKALESMQKTSSERRKRFATMQKEKVSNLSPTDKTKLSSAKQVFQDLSTMEGMVKKRKSMGAFDPQTRKMYDSLNAQVLEKYTSMITGATATEEQKKNFAKNFPETSMLSRENEETALAKIGRAKKEAQRTIDSVGERTTQLSNVTDQINSFKNLLMEKGMSEEEALDAALEAFDKRGLLEGAEQ
jgi:hypothetical protein